jgi:hypothetical protein
MRVRVIIYYFPIANNIIRKHFAINYTSFFSRFEAAL